MVWSRSIRFRITALAVVASTVVLTTASVVMIAVLHRQLTDNFDEGLSQRADTIAAAVATGGTGVLARDEDLLVQVVDADGVVVRSSPNLTGLGPISGLEPGIRTTSDVPGRPEAFRVLARRLDAPVDARLLVGVNADDITESVTIMIRLLAVAIPAVAVMLGAITWWLTGRTLRPVERIRSEMADITGHRLDHRVPEPGTRDEIDRLARTVNETLDRLEDTVRRQQRFVADASHELRGPLTWIRGELELDLAQPAAADLLGTERGVLDETIRLQQLVDDLLLLARSDALDGGMVSTAVDLDDIVLREARRLRERERVRVDTHGVSAAFVTGDPRQLARAVRNLLDNAERHATTTVTLGLVEAGDDVTLTVQDDGDGVPARQGDDIFARFTRSDEARTRDAGGAGLGLAIVRDIVTRHGGTIRLGDGPPTRFITLLPRRH